MRTKHAVTPATFDTRPCLTPCDMLLAVQPLAFSPQTPATPAAATPAATPPATAIAPPPHPPSSSTSCCSSPVKTTRKAPKDACRPRRRRFHLIQMHCSVHYFLDSPTAAAHLTSLRESPSGSTTKLRLAG